MISLGWLPSTAFAFLLIFARVGSILMLVPGLGETTIPARMRLTFALGLTLVMLPLLSAQLPPMPQDPIALLVPMGHEIAVGLILGSIARIAVSGTQVAGSVIAFQAGLSIAQSADPSNNGIQGALIGAFLSFLGVALIFAMDLHHVTIAAIYESYELFRPADPLMLGDASEVILRTAAGAFAVGVQMSAPFIVFGLVFHLGMGILGRLMPQLQVFFIAMPATVLVGLILMALLLSTMMGLYLTHYEAVLAMLRGVQ